MPTTTDLTSLMRRPSGPWWAHADHDRPDLVAMPGVGSVVVAKVTAAVTTNRTVKSRLRFGRSDSGH
jgi:hypothetical protein